MTEKKDLIEENEPEALVRWKKKRERLDDIDISRTLEALGAQPRQDNDRNKWKIFGVGNIIVKDQMWLNGNLQLGGKGSVSLVKHALSHEKDTESMNWLAEQFPEELEGDWGATEVKKKRKVVEKKAFNPPEQNEEVIEKVRNYLVKKRKLPPTLIDNEIKSGRIYATTYEDFSGESDIRCVFIGPRSAEIRSVEDNGFKGCCEGSDSDNSCYQVMFQEPNESIVAICEAAIDALSYHALHPHRFVVSTNGAGRFDLQYKITLEAFRNDFATYLALDADFAGDVAAQRIFNSLYLRDYLSAKYSTSKEQIDEWILQKKILVIPEYSPHELFLNDLNKENSYPVFTNEIDRTDPENPKAKHEDTGKKKKATISFKVIKACGKIKRGAGEEIELDYNEIVSLLKSYKLKRDRPVGAKDYNESWKRLGDEAIKNYENKFSKKRKLQESKSSDKHGNTDNCSNDDVKNNIEKSSLNKTQKVSKWARNTVAIESVDTNHGDKGGVPRFTGRFSRKKNIEGIQEFSEKVINRPKFR